MAWQLVTPDGDVDMTSTIRHGWSLAELRAKVGESARSAMKTFGGPMQFLEQRYPDAAARQTYADKLWAEFPPMDTRPPHSVIPLPSVREHEAHDGVSGSDLVLHLAALDFTSTASMKGPPSLRTANLLVDEILTDGFITLGDPLKVHHLGEAARSVTPPWSQDLSALPGFSVGYVKGAARTCVLHTIVTLCLDDNVSLREAPLGW